MAITAAGIARLMRAPAIILLLMCVLFMVLGLVLYYPARKLNAAIAKSKEATGVM